MHATAKLAHLNLHMVQEYFTYSQFLCSLAFDLPTRGVRQPVQPHTFYARPLVLETLAQPDFPVVNCETLVCNMNMTSNCDVTNSVHQIRMPTTCH